MMNRPLSQSREVLASDTTNHGAATSACCLTGTGRSAVAVIALRGKRSEEALRRCFQPQRETPFKPRQVRYGQWRLIDTQQASDTPTESVVVTPLTEDHYEIHCHGGTAAIKRIMEDLRCCDVQPLTITQWDAITKPLLIRETEEILRKCVTQRTAGLAMSQLNGGLHAWAERILKACQEASQNEWTSQQTDPPLATIHQEATDALEFSSWTVRLSEPFRVVLAGAPNVGKSSLVNAILGYDRSITFDQAGTTRDVLYAETVLDGIPIRLTDTAGLHDLAAEKTASPAGEPSSGRQGVADDLRRQHEQIEREGIVRARREFQEADLIVHVTASDLISVPSPSLSQLKTEHSSTCMIHVVNKSDLASATIVPGRQPNGTFATIATHGSGIDALQRAIVATLIPLFPHVGC